MNLVLVESLRQSDYYFEAPSTISTVEGNFAITPTARYDLVLVATSRSVRVVTKPSKDWPNVS